jgi:tRNA nucleotidyltransferase (CCA-adding enzyme)
MDTSSGVQLVARATTDLVDVGAVARRFGGGGHPRAAAAMIRDSTAKQEYQKLMQALPEIVRPAVMVAEIMSRRPQVLSPEMPVAKAAEQMRRYGYEGYPVVEEGRLVGLLTRRAVDRTLNHKLNLPVRAVMEAGSVTVGPDTPLEQLQQIMTDSGWGQVPVVVGEEIIGIVTRTDLLKVLAPKQASSGRQNLAEKLEASLPAARLALLWAAAKTAREQQAAFYVVGGFVRDLLLERPSLDYDLVVEGDAIQLGEALAERYGGRTTTHKRFGTAKWWIDEIQEQLAAQLAGEFDLNLLAKDLPETLDLVSARREFYTHPTALPTVERGSIKLDLHRRDFTINTLAMRLDGNYYGDLHDHWGGLADLQAGTVRVLHSLSFVDDPTRILRAVRFEQRFDFRIGPRTLELLKNALSLLDRVSGDRLRHELDNILFEENRDTMLARLEELGVLAAIHPALIWDQAARKRVTAALEISPPEGWLKTDRPLQPAAAYLGWLLPSDAEAASEAAERIRLPGWLGDILAQAIQVWEQQSGIGEMKPSQVVEVMAEQPELGLLVCRELSADPAFKEKVSAYFKKWRQVQPVTDGHELRARGIEPGPRYREVLDQLRAAWLDGEISSEAEEKAMLEKLLDG